MEPRDGDIAPERTPDGDFVLYHGTSIRAAESILRERRVRPDDFGAVGVTTVMHAAGVYAAMKSRDGGGSAILRLVIARAWLTAHDITHEIGGSGCNQFLIRGQDVRREGGVPPEALLEVAPVLDRWRPRSALAR